MSGAVSTFQTARVHHPIRATAEPLFVRAILIGIVFIFFTLFLFLPLIVIFKEAFANGIAVFFGTFQDEHTQAAIKLTLLTAAIAVPLNTIFGLAAAWSLTRFDFRGRPFLITLIDLPLWVSPVVGGLIYVLVFGAKGWFGPWIYPTDEMLAHSAIARFLMAHDIRVIFAVPGIVLATIFVTFPFVARGLIPLMQAQGTKEEEAALSLGANGWQIFWRVTLPKIKWGLLYGIILCNARAMGEFGAVTVVSGNIAGSTNTMPLQIETLYHDYGSPRSAPFAVASVLSILALLTLIIKTFAEWRAERQLAEAAAASDLPVKR
ncbi:MAG: sulfate ABC transporter permease subunit CysW [Chthoniobacterales bacterium]